MARHTEEIRVFRTCTAATLPTQATDLAQCIDLYAAEDVEILPGQTKLVDLGIKMILPEGYGLEFRERSGLATKGIIIGAGIIDEDYHGPLKAVVRYLQPDREVVTREPFKISTGDKIVQAELVKRVPIIIEDISSGSFESKTKILNSNRGEKGFGSSG
jgi:dUTP pyrophosphatase